MCWFVAGSSLIVYVISAKISRVAHILIHVTLTFFVSFSGPGQQAAWSLFNKP